MPSKKNRVYIASKLNHSEEAVAMLRDELDRRGYELVYDWTQFLVPKPFEQNLEAAHEAAEAMAEAVRVCDHLILLCAPNGLGMYIEMGGALVSAIIMNFITKEEPKRLFVVGDENTRSVFYFHRSVQRLPDIPALLEQFPPIR